MLTSKIAICAGFENLVSQKPHGLSHHVAKFAIWGYTGDLDKAISDISFDDASALLTIRSGIVVTPW
jgi:hypothetical protein